MFVTISGTTTQSVAFSVTAVAVSFTQSSTGGVEQALAPAGTPASQPTKADRLVRALDRDQDGAITKDEFTQGAIALLRRAAARQYARAERNDDGPSRADEKRHHGMANRLARVFDRLDANQDGALDVAEMADGLGRRSGGTVEPRAPQAGASSSFTAVAVSVSTIAVQQYTAVSQMAEAGRSSR